VPLGLLVLLAFLLKWCLDIKTKYSLLFPGLYCFPLLLGSLGVETSFQEVVIFLPYYVRTAWLV
jgi:hypothetical protein